MKYIYIFDWCGQLPNRGGVSVGCWGGGTKVEWQELWSCQRAIHDFIELVFLNNLVQTLYHIFYACRQVNMLIKANTQTKYKVFFYPLSVVFSWKLKIVLHRAQKFLLTSLGVGMVPSEGWSIWRFIKHAVKPDGYLAWSSRHLGKTKVYKRSPTTLSTSLCWTTPHSLLHLSLIHI